MAAKKMTGWLLGIGAVTAATVAMFSSCGDSNDSGSDSDRVEVTITDGSQPTTVSAGQLAVTFDGGTLETGTVVVLETVDVPTEFSALADIPAGSTAISCTASKDSQDLPEAKGPFTIAITLNEAAGLVDKVADNLCVFVKGPETKGVWRRTSLTVNEAKTEVTLKSPRFGVYMVAYCGDAELEGFETMTGGPVPSGGDGDLPTAFPFACYQTPYKFCQYMRGTEAGANFEQALAHCSGNDQQGVASAQCPEENFAASCDGENTKSYYYEGHDSVPTSCFDGETFSDEYSEAE